MEKKEIFTVDSLSYLVFGAVLYLSMRFLTVPATILILCAGILLMILDFKPRLILFLLLLSVPFETARDIFASFTVYTTEALLFAACLSWLIRDRKVLFPERKLLFSIILLFIAIFLSFSVSKDLSSSIKQTVRWLEVFAAYLFCLNFVRERRDVEFLVKSILVAGSIAAIIGIVQFATGGFDYRRAVSVFGSYDAFAGYLLIIVPLSLALSVNEKARGKTLFYGSSFLVLVLSLLATFSRGGWSGFLAALIILFLISRTPARKKLIWVFGILILLFILIFSLMPSSFEQRGFPAIEKQKRLTGFFSNLSVQKRFHYWKAGMESIRAHLPFGLGLGNYTFVHKKYGITVISDGEDWVGDTIVLCKSLIPNTTYHLSLDCMVVGGKTGGDDFLELVKFGGKNEPGNRRVFQTCAGNTIALPDNKEWTRIEGSFFTATGLKSLSNVQLRWAHNEKASVRFREISMTSKAGDAAELDYSPFHLHNLYLQFCVEAGITGLAGLLYFIFTHLAVIFSKLKDEPDSAYYVIRAGCLCGVFGFLVHSFFDILLTHSIGVLFGIVLALAVLPGKRYE